MQSKLTKTQVLAIPKLLEKKSIGQVARDYGVSFQAIYYWVKKLRLKGYQVTTRSRGRKGILD